MYTYYVGTIKLRVILKNLTPGQVSAITPISPSSGHVNNHVIDAKDIFNIIYSIGTYFK